MNYTNLQYKGKVNLKVKFGGQVYEVANYNSGLMWLQFAFCKLMVGDTIDDSLHPQYLDLRILDDGDWKTYLQNTIQLSGKTINPEMINGERVYTATLTAVLSSASLQGDIVSGDTHEYRLYLYSLSSSGTKNDFAYIDISPEVLARISPGVQALVEWTMQLLLDEAEVQEGD